jgi:polysaccharide biosynthesis/export protein
MQRAQAGGSGLFGLFRLHLVLAAGLLLTSGATAQESQSAPPPDPQTVFPAATQEQDPSDKTGETKIPPAKADSDSEPGAVPLRLGVGDLLDISVYNVPELNTKARISNTGDIYLPLIDYIHVADLSLEEAQALIAKRLEDGGFLKNPHVTVFINEYASQAVTILGEVQKPGPYPMMGERRLYDLISAAGGLTEKAGRTVTISHRNKPNEPQTIRLAEGLAQTSESNVPIQPGDTIVVRRAGIVYVVGAVVKPSGFLMDNDSLTVLKVIALAGGTTRTAKLNGAKLLRKTPEGLQETGLSVKKILQLKSPDLPLQAEDILFIPTSAGKAAAYRGTEAILSAATALTIVGVRP